MIGLCEVLSDREKIPQEIFDGALNYTCTQLYRKIDAVSAGTLALMLLNYFYLKDPRYVKIKDATGLLNTIFTLFDAEEVKSLVNDKDEVLESISMVIVRVAEIYVAYEKVAKQRNGDLE